MAIVDTKRPAIEQLFKQELEATPPIELYTLVENTKLRLSDGTPLYFLGISEGCGIYSRHRGINVLCLGLEKPQKPCQHTIPSCDYAVLLRDSTEDERSSAPEYTNNYRSCAELLAIETITKETVIFKPAGELSLYVPI